MMNEAKQNGGPGAAIVRFNFHGDELQVATTPDGEHWVVLARLCEPLGLRDHPQAEKLKRLPWAGVRIIRVPSPGGEQETFCLNIRSVAGWLFTLNAGKVAPRLREKLARYQKECADALADHFLGPRGARSEPTMTPKQVAEIAAAVCVEVIERVVMPAIRQIAAAGSQGATITGLQAEDLRLAITMTAYALVAVGDAEKLGQARMMVLNHVIAVSGWGGPGRKRALMPAAVYPVVMASLSSWQKALDKRLVKRRAARPERAPAQGSLFGSRPAGIA